MPPDKKRCRHDWTLPDKIWLLDFHSKNPKMDAVGIGKELSEHVNESRTRDQAEISPPGKSTVNDWISHENCVCSAFAASSESTQCFQTPLISC